MTPQEAEVVLAAQDYVLSRGWAVLGDDHRCHDCHAHVDTENHAEGCDYNHLRLAVIALTEARTKEKKA